jgi:hypothetical protein
VSWPVSRYYACINLKIMKENKKKTFGMPDNTGFKAVPVRTEI